MMMLARESGRRESRVVVDIYLYDVSDPAARDHVALSLYDVASSTTCHRHSSAAVEPSYNEREERREDARGACIDTYVVCMCARTCDTHASV